MGACAWAQMGLGIDDLLPRLREPASAWRTCGVGERGVGWRHSRLVNARGESRQRLRGVARLHDDETRGVGTESEPREDLTLKDGQLEPTDRAACDRKAAMAQRTRLLHTTCEAPTTSWAEAEASEDL